MAIEQTLAIIKPEAVQQNLIGSVIQLLESKGLIVVALKMHRLSLEEAQRFYAIHKEKSFFNDLVSYMTSGPVVLAILEGENAVSNYRTLMGSTNPLLAEKGTIRSLYGTSIEQNAVHGSDSLGSAAQEIAQFFSAEDTFSRNAI